MIKYLFRLQWNRLFQAWGHAIVPLFVKLFSSLPVKGAQGGAWRHPARTREEDDEKVRLRYVRMHFLCQFTQNRIVY